MSKNKRLSEKAGIFLGEALISNPDHPVQKLSFKKVCLQEDGLLRILEASNANHHITKLNLGLVTDRGLAIMAKTLCLNQTLQKLKFAEHEDAPWSEQSQAEFVSMIKGHRNLVKVKFDESKGCDHSAFKKEIEFFVKKIKKSHKNQDKIEDRKESCTTDHLFKGLLTMIEDREEH